MNTVERADLGRLSGNNGNAHRPRSGQTRREWPVATDIAAHPFGHAARMSEATTL